MSNAGSTASVLSSTNNVVKVYCPLQKFRLSGSLKQPFDCNRSVLPVVSLDSFLRYTVVFILFDSQSCMHGNQCKKAQPRSNEMWAGLGIIGHILNDFSERTVRKKKTFLLFIGYKESTIIFYLNVCLTSL